MDPYGNDHNNNTKHYALFSNWLMLGTSMPCAKECKTGLNCFRLIMSNISFHSSTHLSLTLCNRTNMVASKSVLHIIKVF